MEFHGVLSVGGETFITLVDAAKSRSFTIPLGASVEGITVSELSLEPPQVRASAGASERVLSLHESRVVPLAPMAQPPPRSGAGVGRRVPDDHVAREIARRREMRRQLLQAQNPATVSPPNSDTAAP
jgi:hypothetical protein